MYLIKNYLLVILVVLSTVPVYSAEFIGIANKVDGEASFIDLQTKEIHSVQVGFQPHELTATDSYAYVSNYGSNHIRSISMKDQPGNTLSVIRLSDFSLAGDIDLGAKKCAPHGIVASPKQDFIYVTCEARHEILAIDTQTNKVSYSIPTNQAGSHMMVINSTGSKAYVANFWIGTVTVIDLQQRKIEKLVSVGRMVEGIAISPDDKFIYVTRVEEGELIKIDSESLQIAKKANLGAKSSPIRVVVSRDGKKLIVNHSSENRVGIYDAESFSLLNSFNVGRRPIGISLSDDGNLIYVANMLDSTITSINLNLNKVIENFMTYSNSPDGIIYIKK